MTTIDCLEGMSAERKREIQGCLLYQAAVTYISDNGEKGAEEIAESLPKGSHTDMFEATVPQWEAVQAQFMALKDTGYAHIVPSEDETDHL